MKVKSAKFVTSAVKPAQYPEAAPAEIAFAGRSNVGKSSLINTLVGRKNLVKTSGTPGKTRLINFFLVNGRYHFVDLPGYGYARVPAKERMQWGQMVEAYLQGRPTLKGVVLITDIRRGPEEEEFELAEFLHHIRMPFFNIFTKADKLSQNKQNAQVQRLGKKFAFDAADIICFSAKTGQGLDRIWQQIDALIEPVDPGADKHPSD
ncbi:MAG: ribosome biogenesis GTP-binding protein YihA/YsxC [Thermodesulfobacteriota bacterium]